MTSNQASLRSCRLTDRQRGNGGWIIPGRMEVSISCCGCPGGPPRATVGSAPTGPHPRPPPGGGRHGGGGLRYEDFTGASADAEAAAELELLHHSESELVRVECAVALGRAGGVEPLVAALQKPHERLRRAAGWGLAAAGPAAVPALLRLLESLERHIVARGIRFIVVDSIASLMRAESAGAPAGRDTETSESTESESIRHFLTLYSV